MSKPIVSLQLYTVRDFTQNDVKGTLKQVKEMGYDHVELAGTYGMEAAEFKKILDEIGLTAYSAHVPFQAFEADLAGTVAAYKTLGCKIVAVPYLDMSFLPEGEKYAHTLDIMNQAARLCKEAGMILGYHNHAFEFKVMEDGTYLLDKFFADMPDTQAELDTGWITAAGLTPASYIEKYAGRCPIIHLKDTVAVGDKFEDRPVGKGSQDIPASITAALKGGAAGFVVELDESVGMTSLEAAKQSREYLKSIGY